MNRLFLVVLLVGFIFNTSCKKEQPAELQKQVLTDNPKISDIDKLVDNTFNAYATKPKTAGFSIALIDNNVVRQYNYGETKLGNKTLPNNQSLYEIGSITKTFIAPTILAWINITDIDIPINSPDLGTKISPYLPPILTSQLGLNNTPITFEHLLSHTSGFPRIPNDLPNNQDPYNGYDSTKVYNYIRLCCNVYL